MPAVRLHLDEALAAGVVVDVGPARSHRLGAVLRMGPGDAVIVFNGRDGEFHTVVESAARRRYTLRLGDRLRRPEPESDIWLLFAPIKRGPIDFLVGKATELGAAAVWPVTTTRTTARRVGLGRLRCHAVEAAELCGRTSVPELRPPVPLDRALRGWPADRRLFWCDEGGGGRAAATAFSEAPARAALLVGPEGGFTEAERTRLRSHPAASAVDLGPRLMRAETAALAALACWQAAAGDWAAAGRAGF